ncbi:MAG: hypothetical protein EPN26_08000 [Rhodospirillales bacterium]|nr:MAG: hypothetical protein EPN26_08000 [Rhodospirillales bacterium]
MAVAAVKTVGDIGYGTSSSTARAPLSVRDAATSQAFQIGELQGSQLAGARAETSTPDGYEGTGPLPRQLAQITPTRVPNFGSVGLVPIAYFIQEKSEAQSSGSPNGLARGLGPHAANKGAGIYESSKRAIEGTAQENYRFS